MNTKRTQAGFSLLEVTIGSVLAVAGLITIGSVLKSTQNLTEDTRVHTRATAEHRRNLEALSNLLRNVDITTLDGFREDGVATTLTFQRVTGADLADRSYETQERLEWRSEDGEVWGIARPGGVWLVGEPEPVLLARNVPFDGLQIRQEGNTLAIRLTTYYTIGAQRTGRVTSETAVSMRN